MNFCYGRGMSSLLGPASGPIPDELEPPLCETLTSRLLLLPYARISTLDEELEVDDGAGEDKVSGPAAVAAAGEPAEVSVVTSTEAEPFSSGTSVEIFPDSGTGTGSPFILTSTGGVVADEAFCCREAGGSLEPSLFGPTAAYTAVIMPAATTGPDMKIASAMRREREKLTLMGEDGDAFAGKGVCVRDAPRYMICPHKIYVTESRLRKSNWSMSECNMRYNLRCKNSYISTNAGP